VIGLGTATGLVTAEKFAVHAPSGWTYAGRIAQAGMALAKSPGHAGEELRHEAGARHRR